MDNFYILIKNQYLTTEHKPQTITDIKFIKLWLNEYKNSKQTFTLYYSVIFRFYYWIYHKNLHLQNVRYLHLLEYQSFLFAPDPSWCGKRCGYSDANWRPYRQALSPATINLSMTIISSLFNYLYNIDYLDRSLPCSRIKKISVPHVNKDNYFTSNEISHIFKWLAGLSDLSIYQKHYKSQITWLISLLVFTGCRRSELSSATMADIVVSNSGRNVWLNVIGKGNKPGKIPIPDILLLELNRYRAIHGLPPIHYRRQHESHIPLIIRNKLANNSYLSVSDDWIYQVVKAGCKKVANNTDDEILVAKLLSASPHWFRHTYASLQIESGIDLRIVQQNLRHSSFQTTLRYIHDQQDFRYFETISKFKSIIYTLVPFLVDNLKFFNGYFVY